MSAKLRYLALGDSYSIGEGVLESQRWPNQLCALWRQRGVDIDLPVFLATTGWTTDELLHAMDDKKIEQEAPFDLISLLIGVNNQYRGRSVENYRAEFSTLLTRAILCSGNNRKRVFVVSIPDWGVTRFAQTCGRDTKKIAREIDVFNHAAKKICLSRGIRFINISKISRDQGADPRMQALDGLHPSATMYQRWSQRINTAFCLDRDP